MLGNCEKMAVISSTSKDWPQHNQSNEKGMMMASANRVMEQPAGQEQQQQQQLLKCPRCDSTNTKFCYYNNYSLSQPRHFCKACKRYWTRGGTLRNVPVGGGCRKNKRAKRPTSATDIASSSASSVQTGNPSLPAQPNMGISSTTSHMNPLLFGLPSNPSQLNIPSLSRFNIGETVSGYGFHPQLNALGLGFSSGIMSNTARESYTPNDFDSNKNIQDLFTSKSLLTSYSSMSGNPSCCPTTTTSPTMASLLSSNFQQQRIINTNMKEAQGANDFQAFGNQSEDKEVKTEGLNNLEHNGLYHNQIGSNNLSDPSLYWNATTTASVGSWHDPTNMGSSVPSLI